jgi:hypothetical protein
MVKFLRRIGIKVSRTFVSCWYMEYLRIKKMRGEAVRMATDTLNFEYLRWMQNRGPRLPDWVVYFALRHGYSDLYDNHTPKDSELAARIAKGKSFP